LVVRNRNLCYNIGTERINADLYNRSGEKTTQPENKLHTNIITPDDEEKGIEAETEAPETASESTETLEEISKKYGAQAQAMIHTYREGQDVIKYDSAYKIAYDMGKSGGSLSYVMNSEATSYLSKNQRQLAYEAGKAAAEKSSLSLKLDTNSDIIEKTEDSNENGESVHLRKGGQRTGGTDTEGQISRVEGGSGQNQSRQNARRAADSKAAKLVNEGREVTVASLGIAGGSESHKVRLVESGSETASMKKAREIAEARGLKVKFFVGNNLIINDKKGGVISARAYILGNQMLVRADHPYYTSEQLARHEVGHDKIAKGEVNITKVRERLEETVGKENIDSVADLYAEAYEGSGLTADEIWEECICDSLGDMNIFAKDAEISEFMGNMLSEISAVASESKSPTQTRGSPEGKASRETYWYPKLSQREWSLLNSKLDKELESSDNFIDKSTKWLYADVKGVKVFAIYGIGNGSEATILYAVGGKSAEILSLWRDRYESGIDRTKQNAYRRHLEHIGVEQNQYVNSTNRNSKNNISGELKSFDGVGRISSGTQRGNNGGTVSNDSGQGKASRELAVEENYTEEEYNNFGWARENEVLSAKENERLRSLFADAVSKQANPPRTKSGEYMIAIGENVENKIAYMTGEIDNPVITRVLEIDEYNETKLDEIRRNIYAFERSGIQRQTGGLFTLYTAANFGNNVNAKRSGLQISRYNDQFGTERGRGSKTAPRVKEYLFDENGQVISEKYSRELDFIDYINENAEPEEQKSNRELLANALESVTVNDVEAKRLAQYKANIAQLNTQSEKLSLLKRELKELSFSEGSRDTVRIRELRDEIIKTENRINIYDEKLLNLEATKPLRDVLEREKKKAYDKAKQKGKEALEAQRKRSEAKLSETKAQYREARARGIESRNKTAMRHKIKDVVSDLNKLLLNPTEKQHVPIGLQKVVAEALDAINMDSMNAEERVAYYNDLISKENDPNEIATLTKKERFLCVVSR